MPIVASRSAEIRRLLIEISDPKRRAAASVRLRALGSRVVPYVAEELGRFDAVTRHALLEALREVDTADAAALRLRLSRAEPGTAASRKGPADPPQPARDHGSGGETKALADLRALPPPGPSERATVSRERGEAHLALARTGSRLARKELLLSLQILSPGRTRLYCEAAGLIGDSAFLAPLARIASVQPEAQIALSRVARREKITARSRVLRGLEPKLRPIVALALANPGHANEPQ